jgi:hypothetical protein
MDNPNIDPNQPRANQPNQPVEPIENTVLGREVTPEEVAYRDGLVQGRTQQEERIYQEELRLRQARQQAVAARRSNNGAFLGVALTVVVLITGGVIWAAAFYNRDPAPTQPEQNVEVPAAPDTPETPQSETTIIERTIDRTREVVPSPPQVIERTVPAPTQPAPQAQPAPTQQAPAQPAPESQSAPEPTGEATDTTENSGADAAESQ